MEIVPTSSPTSSLMACNKDTALGQLLVVSKTVLGQAVDVIDNRLTSDDQLTVSSQFLPGSTIGKHLRHANDHFCLLLNCISGPKPYTFSYDTRIRNTPMESERASAKQALLDTMQRLEEILPLVDVNEPMTLHAVTPFFLESQTSFGRELWFACLHGVHHWSQIRVIAGELGIFLSDEFGFAPSTLVYQGKEVPLGKAKI